MHFGYIFSDTPGVADKTLTKFAAQLERRGVRLAGITQTNTETAKPGRCDMDVRVLGGGPVIAISQCLGAGSRGCRLNPGALEQATAEVASRLDQRIDAMIINKFGKQEGEGRGFRPLIAEALERGIPVLTSVNALNLDAFERFACGLAEQIPADLAALEAWLKGCAVSKAA